MENIGEIMRKWIVAAALAFNAAALPLGTAAAQSPEVKPVDPPNKFTLLTSVASHHFGQRGYWDKGEYRPFNEFNPGVGLEYKLSDHIHLSAGTYRNSVYRQSVYAGVGFETGGNKQFGLGIELGGITGYNEMPVVPSAIPFVRIGDKNGVNAKVMVIPPVKNLTPAVVGLQFRVPIG